MHPILLSFMLSIAAAAGTLQTAQKELKLPTGVYAQFVTSQGNFTVRLFDQEAPKTVENFIGLAEGTKEWTDPRTNKKVKRPYYDGVDRRAVLADLNARGVNAVFHYVPLHSAPAGLRFGRVATTMDVTDDCSRRLIRLPLWIGMAPDAPRQVIEAVEAVLTLQAS